MADEFIEQNPNTNTHSLLRKLMGKRRTWVCLFVLVYALLLSFSWNLLRSTQAWYDSNTLSSSSSSAFVSASYGLPALYASLLFGAVFGILTMVAALSVVIPATVVTWITVVVLLTFFGKPYRALVLEGRIITTDIVGFVIKILIKEGNIIAVICAVVGYFMLIGRSRKDD